MVKKRLKKHRRLQRHYLVQVLQQICLQTELTEADLTDGNIDIMTLLVKCGLTASKSEARRAVQQGGVSVDGEKITDIAHTFAGEDFGGEGIVLKKGKKNFRKVIVK